MTCRYIFTSLLVLSLVGCASGPMTSTFLSSGYSSKTYEPPVYIRNTTGNTVARIQNGNIYSTTGPTAGQRIGRIGK